jgi:hypothetical protein
MDAEKLTDVVAATRGRNFVTPHTYSSVRFSKTLHVRFIKTLHPRISSDFLASLVFNLIANRQNSVIT